MKQFECFTHLSDFIRKVRNDGTGQLIGYDELRELRKQGREPGTARQGGKWIFKRETDSLRKTEQGRSIKPDPTDFDRGF
jgi:hypothetical protein